MFVLGSSSPGKDRDPSEKIALDDNGDMAWSGEIVGQTRQIFDKTERITRVGNPRIPFHSGERQMKTKHYLTLADVKKIAAACEAEAVRNNWGVVIAITDDGGHLLWLQRMDGARPANSEVAILKAHTAAVNRKPTKVREDLIRGGRISVLKMPGLPVEGGVPIMYQGEYVGAIGVSGVQSEEDTQIANAGMAVLAS